MLLSHSRSCRKKRERSDTVLLNPCSHPSAYPQLPSFLLWLLGSQLLLRSFPPTKLFALYGMSPCPHHPPDLQLSYFDLHFLFCPLLQILQCFSICSDNSFKGSHSLCLIIFHCSYTFLNILLIAVPMFSPLPLLPQTTLWLFLFFLFFQNPHCYFYHTLFLFLQFKSTNKKCLSPHLHEIILCH